ncbi:uncharacterized protein LOC116619457 [Nematostella vectensis]|uniref:uncharacterized protein LOC116619457 n=1 Tax=Nematostella vectensis TaxID=45351 RepID=UPI00138FCDF9|nr:uncharacterized protein LOC116619457 [Nematostella vectensis]
MIFVLVLALCAAPSLAQMGRKIDGWTQLTTIPVCFEGRNDRFGQLIYLGDSKLVAGIKLVYRSGVIRCVSNTAHDSHWGCHHYSSFYKYPLNVVITDKKNNIIYPLAKYIKRTADLWYHMPGVDDLISKELVFTNVAKPFYLERYRELRIWYGEDLRNNAESDNQGRVCVDVFAKFFE